MNAIKTQRSNAKAEGRYDAHNGHDRDGCRFKRADLVRAYFEGYDVIKDRMTHARTMAQPLPDVFYEKRGWA